MPGLPPRLVAMLDRSLTAVHDAADRADLGAVAHAVAAAVWDGWLERRPADDNRPEHEFVVFAAAARIAEAERLTPSERRVVAAFCFAHDTHFIPRITETTIRAAGADADRLRAAKDRQRREHMAGGARTARDLLPRLTHPDRPGEPLLTAAEVERCADIIAGHDRWKLGDPHPPAADRVAVVCLEADALYPLHPLGVQADLERPAADGLPRDASDPAVWAEQLRQSLRTLHEYRANWDGVAGETFPDGVSIFRTAEGHRQYREWRVFWNL